MFKNRTMGFVIAVSVAIVTLISMGVVFYVANRNITSVLTENVENTMDTALDARTELIDDYVSNAELELKSFSKAPAVKNFLKDTKNQKNKAILQAYNLEYFKDLYKWEGLYIDDMNSEVFTHSNVKAVGMIMRKGDSLKQLQDSVTGAKDSVYNTGILQSPASGQLIISMYSPVFEGDKPIGFAGGAIQTEGLAEQLKAITTYGCENATYSFINVETGQYIYDNDEELIGQDIENKQLQEVMERIKGGEEDGLMKYTGEDGEEYFSVFKSIPKRGWALVVRDKVNTLYAPIYNSRIMLLVVCGIATILIIAVSWLMINFNMRPLKKVIKKIEKVKNLDLSDDKTIDRYVGLKSEVGKLATSVNSLTSTFRKIINTLNECAVSLTGSSDTMRLTSEDLRESVENNAATTEELSASVINTNSSIDVVTSEVEKINEIVGEINESVENGNEKSETLIQTANTMSRVAGETLDSNKEKIEETKNRIEEAMENLQSLAKIDEMATQILDITSQTNLLSLNASIEAARAGEAGKGFAVVAGEIGSLAENSSKTVTQIQALCEEANQSIASVKACFEDIVSFMESDVSGKFQKFADMASDYESVVNDIQAAIGNINDTSIKFSECVSSIREQVQHVNEASSDNAQGVEDIIMKNDLTMETADAIIGIADENQTNVTAIRDIIDRFN